MYQRFLIKDNILIIKDKKKIGNKKNIMNFSELLVKYEWKNWRVVRNGTQTSLSGSLLNSLLSLLDCTYVKAAVAFATTWQKTDVPTHSNKKKDF